MTVLTTTMSRDPTTQSNYLSVVTEHVHFDWTIDFEEKLITGAAIHTLLVKDDKIDQIVLVYYSPSPATRSSADTTL